MTLTAGVHDPARFAREDDYAVLPEGVFIKFGLVGKSEASPATGRRVLSLSFSQASTSDTDGLTERFEPIKPRAYLKSMLAIVLSAFHHPFETTVIDLDTGEIVNHSTN